MKNYFKGFTCHSVVKSVRFRTMNYDIMHSSYVQSRPRKHSLLLRLASHITAKYLGDSMEGKTAAQYMKHGTNSLYFELKSHLLRLENNAHLCFSCHRIRTVRVPFVIPIQNI